MKRAVIVLVRNPLLSLWDFFAELGSLTKFTYAAVLSALLPPYKRSITRRQMDAIGVGSIPIVVMTGLFMGLVLALQAIVELRNLGATTMMGRPVGTTVVRELGPVLTAMMVAARCGSAITAELASMAISEQLDALRAEGSDPIKKLVEPRLVACTVMMPILTILCIGVAFLGAWVVAARDIKLNSHFYWNSVLEVLKPEFLWGGLFKAVCFGFLVGVIACYTGMNTKLGSAEVGRSTTQTVVIASILILASDFLITKFLTVFWW
ncbi:MAG: ABC transporter permease [Candidatus Omnitrophota bacterium]|jgi:phospholipid/cholesterol/gamma-HCH transport system permease protein